MRFIIPALALLLSASCATAHKQLHYPLYKDSTGWEVRSAKSGVEIAPIYLNAKETASYYGWEMPPSAGFREIAKDPVQYYGFALIIPNGVYTYWNSGSEITLTTVTDGDTSRVTCTDYFFTDRYQTQVIFGHDMFEGLWVPNAAMQFFVTGRGNVVVFARFPITEEPEFLVRCDVTGVTSKTKGGRE